MRNLLKFYGFLIFFKFWTKNKELDFFWIFEMFFFADIILNGYIINIYFEF